MKKLVRTTSFILAMSMLFPTLNSFAKSEKNVEDINEAKSVLTQSQGWKKIEEGERDVSWGEQTTRKAIAAGIAAGVGGLLSAPVVIIAIGASVIDSFVGHVYSGTVSYEVFELEGSSKTKLSKLDLPCRQRGYLWTI
ncbi:MAG: hypothetical protein Q4B52_08295 [Tissierellia bacterium]|nr:hypothetical protein [Tissierellia bacterium]